MNAAAERARRFDAVLAALALAEERGAVPLTDVAVEVGIDAETLRALLEPVLYLDFRLSARGGRPGEEIDESRGFFLTEDRTLMLDETHWLRDLAAAPPPPELALHLLAAGLTYQACTDESRPRLEAALERLAEVVAAAVHVGIETPALLGTAREAAAAHRTLRFRYVKAGLADPTDREIEPHRVFCNWGNWYAYGPEIGGGTLKYFRVDRMVSAEVGDGTFEVPDDFELPDFFDLSEHAVDLTVRVPRRTLRLLEADYRVRTTRPAGEGRTEVELTAYGEATLDRLLLRLPPEAAVVDPPELADRRRRLAAAVLARYE